MALPRRTFILRESSRVESSRAPNNATLLLVVPLRAFESHFATIVAAAEANPVLREATSLVRGTSAAAIRVAS